MTKNKQSALNAPIHDQEKGVADWQWQRRSAILLIPLTLWLITSLIHHLGVDASQARAWVKTPLIAVLLGLFSIAMFYHSKLGLQAIIEDYIDHLSTRESLLRVSAFVCWSAMFSALVSIARIVFSS
ncbi:MAG: succinate dehydrogenase, hydrophobic membrane anchor protein [Arenicellales bacterium]